MGSRRYLGFPPIVAESFPRRGADTIGAAAAGRHPIPFCFLALSALVSESPLLTLFIVYQMGVMLFLGFFFVRRYGPRACLVRLFWGYTILFVPSGILALAAPAAAFQALPSGGLQLRVDWITLGVGQVAALAIILLLTIALPIPRVFYPILFALYVAILVLSYTRSAYLCLFAFVCSGACKRERKVSRREGSRCCC